MKLPAISADTHLDRIRRQALGLSPHTDLPRLAARLHDRQTQAVESVSLRSLEGIVVARIAVGHADEPSRSFHLELHEVVGDRHDVTFGIENLNLYVRNVLTASIDSVAIDAQT